MENVLIAEKLNFVLKPTLQHMAMAKIAIQMWIQDDVVAVMPKPSIYYPIFDDDLKVIIKMRQKVHNLPLPEVLKTKLWPFIKPVGTQISEWYQYLNRRLDLERINPKELCWTPHGTIDKKKSVQILLRDQRLDGATRCKLACTYCFVDEIGDLLKELPKPSISDFNKVGNWRQELVLFWTYYLGEEQDELKPTFEWCQVPNMTPGLYAFQAAVLTFNSVAAKYVFENMLNPVEEKTLICDTRGALKTFSIYCNVGFNCDFTPQEFVPDLLCSLFSRMNRDQQMKMFEERLTTVLQSLLIWPYQSLFVETAKRMWRFLSEKQFTFLLFKIFDKIEHGCKVCVSRDIFYQFWQLSSVEYRKYVIGDRTFKNNLYEMLRNGEVDIFMMILADADAGEKEKLVFDIDKRLTEIDFYKEIIINEKWDMLKFFLEQCAPSEKKIVEAKNFMVKINENRNQIRKFFQIMDSFISDRKRSDKDTIKDK